MLSTVTADVIEKMWRTTQTLATAWKAVNQLVSPDENKNIKENKKGVEI